MATHVTTYISLEDSLETQLGHAMLFNIKVLLFININMGSQRDNV